MQSPAAELSEKIKEAAQQLGFALVGISPVMSPPHEESFARWLARELAGELEYMRRTESLRRDRGDWAVGEIRHLGGNELLHGLPSSSAMSSQPNGWISRYAWGDLPT